MPPKAVTGAKSSKKAPAKSSKKAPAKSSKKAPAKSSKKAPAKTSKKPAAAVVKKIETGAERLVRLLEFDREVLISGRLTLPAQTIIGTDEVGRGCLAGPVVACAVVLPPMDPGSELAETLFGLNDSKMVLPAVRTKLSETLKRICRYAIAEATVDEIDEINILQASFLAMRRAIEQLQPVSQAVILVDGNKSIPRVEAHEQITVVDGDTKSASIAAASIIAKVHRDELMCKLANEFPEYKWDSNKGYGSPEHRAALQKLGRTVWHRRSFSCGIDDEADSE